MVGSLTRVIAFRFGAIAAALCMVAVGFPFALIPGTDGLWLVLMTGWHWLVIQFGALLGIDVPPLAFTGSGDQLFHYVQMLLIVVLAIGGAGMWSLVDRRRVHPRLATATTVALRYFVAAVMIGYGMAKVTPMQFPPLFYARYDQAIGDMSPMGLLWSFMGHSQAYTWFAGAAEVAGAVLLLWRRTYVVGALILIAAMTNVVVLNFCYDVPVKLLSSELLVMLLVLVAPHARRMLGALLGYPVREFPPRPRGSIMTERVRLTIKLAMIALIALRAYDQMLFADELRRMRAPTPLQGSWRAEHVAIDGVEHPPLLTDDARWRKLIFHEYGLVVRYATDRRQWFRIELDPNAHTITLLEGVMRVVWRYQRVDAQHLVVDAPHVHAELVREPEPLLPSRGFHWVQEAPFNR